MAKNKKKECKILTGNIIPETQTLEVDLSNTPSECSNNGTVSSVEIAFRGVLPTTDRQYICTVNTQRSNRCIVLLLLDRWQQRYLMKWLATTPWLLHRVCEYCKGFAKTEQDYIIAITTYTSKEWLDYAWSGRICNLVCRQVLLEDTMNWLSTLGGGYSALGDQQTHSALEAGRISMKQLRVAMEMGDPPTVIRCRLYYALSLMQTGRLRMAKYLIRGQYKISLQYESVDRKLLNMCSGLWTRLQYMYHIRNQSQICKQEVHIP